MTETHRTNQLEVAPNGPNTAMRPYPGIPGWVKLVGILTLVAILLFGIMHLTGGHGPSDHVSSSGEHMPSTTQHMGQ
jgi:hypothetical protein